MGQAASQERLPSLVGMSQPEIEAWLARWPSPPPAYRARQLFAWVQARSARTFTEMTDLPLPFREQLAGEARLTALTVRTDRRAADGTRKFLFGLPDGGQIESVWIPAAERSTVCLSTQAGCGMGCRFCATGQSGLQRNLTVGEIVDQVHWIIRQTGRPVDHVVYMGMGEPLANYEATLGAVRLLNEAGGLHIGMRHQTISTSGLVPRILRLAQERLQLTLAVSLHAPNDPLRSQLMPINRRYPLHELLTACRQYVQQTNRRITFEYILIDQVNDAPEQARQLRHLLSGLLCHVNLIPFNPVPGLAWRPSRPQRQRAFYEQVQGAGFSVTLRRKRGGEIEAACGQLRCEFERQEKAAAGSAMPSPACQGLAAGDLAEVEAPAAAGSVASKGTNEYS